MIYLEELTFVSPCLLDQKSNISYFVYYSCWSLLNIILLTSCANYNYPQSDAVRQPDVVYELLEYFYDIKQLSSEDLNKEYQKVNNLFLTDSGHDTALRLALLLILPNSEFKNESQALAILEDYDFSGVQGEKSLQNFVFLLKNIVNEYYKKELLYEITSKRLSVAIEEKRKQEILYEESNKKLRNIIKKSNEQDILSQKIHKELDEKEQVVRKLLKKIEELKAIERSISERKNVKAPTT
jgi:hypothetical protein